MALVLVGSLARMGMVQAGSGLCPVAQAYQALAEQFGMAESLHLPGRIDPAAVADYYGLLDLVVIPRRPLPVCELVSPLEAAAHDKRVLMSDVAPLAELTAAAVTTSSTSNKASPTAWPSKSTISSPHTTNRPAVVLSSSS